MIKAVFFDWMNTLAHPEPDRHEQYCQAAQELGVSLVDLKEDLPEVPSQEEETALLDELLPNGFARV